MVSSSLSSTLFRLRGKLREARRSGSPPTSSIPSSTSSVGVEEIKVIKVVEKMVVVVTGSNCSNTSIHSSNRAESFVIDERGLVERRMEFERNMCKEKVKKINYPHPFEEADGVANPNISELCIPQT